MEGRKIKLKAGVDSGFLESVITRDITTMASIFDLIDNSIDAAKEHMLATKKVELDEYNMPGDYSGYEVSIALEQESFSIKDNCLGIEEEILADHALRVGKPSNHEYGLGKFGIGLKRALFKFGTHYKLTTDTGKEAFETEFTNGDLGGTSEIEATEIISTGSPFTLFVVSSLKKQVKNELTSDLWLKKLEQQIESRYGLFIDKGLVVKLKLHGHRVKKLKSNWPKFHKEHPQVPPDKWHKKAHGVDVYIEYGLHTDFVLKANYGVNNPLLKDGNPFGWYVICNDRVIEMAIREGLDYGWKKAWHNEYNGFVGYIRFNSKSVELLPWDSTKTKIITDDLIFLELQDKLSEMALEFRRVKKNALKNEGDESEGDGVETSKGGKSSSQIKKPIKKPKPRPLTVHARDRDILVDWNICQTEVPESRTKEFDIFGELCRLNSKETPIACVVMLRVFLETTIKQVSIGMGLQWKDLSKTTKKVTEELFKLNYIDHIIKGLVLQYARTDGGIFTINSIQSQIHSTRFHPNQSKVNNYWDELDPFLAGCWRYLSDHDNKD